MRNLRTEHVIAVIGLLVAAGLAYAATRTTGPVPLPAFTELRSGPLMEHVISAEELLTEPVYVPHHYPGRVAPHTFKAIRHGFAPLYALPDPQAAALPAEQAV